jgi:tripartite-type tricarboxylate transporter receptor subunit TctC
MKPTSRVRWPLQRVLAGALAACAVFIGATGAQAAPQVLVPSASAVFDWAEANYPELFPQRASNQLLAPYVYRHHPGSGNYVGVAGTGIWLLGPVVGPGSAPVYFGETASLACQVYPASCTQTSSYPERPLSLVVPAAAGGPTDGLARSLAAALARNLGVAVTVRNVTGRDGTEGAAQVAQALPDGYTLLLHTVALASTATSYRNLGYSAPVAFDFLGLVAETPLVLVSRASFPATGLGGVLAWLRANPGLARLGHSGVGAVPYLCAAMLQQRLGVVATLVAYSGTSPLLSDLLAGRADLACAEAHSVAPYLPNRQLLAHALTSAQPSGAAGLAGLPTLQQGVSGGFVLTSWIGLSVPAGTPAVVRERLNAALRKATVDSGFVQSRSSLGALPVEDNRAGAVGHRLFFDEQLRSLGDVVRAGRLFAD